MISNWDKLVQPSTPDKATQLNNVGGSSPQAPLKPSENSNWSIQQQNSGSGANIVASGNVSYNEAPASLADKQDEVALILKRGMPYGEARTVLLDKGWQPAYPHPTSGPLRPSDAVGTGDKILSRIFHEEGLHEVESCSTTGFGFCKFLFGSGTGKTIAIITVGNESGEPRKVHRWFFE